MSTNDLDKDLIIEDADIIENDFTDEELADEKIDWKAKALELKGLNQRRATKLKKLKENPSKPIDSKKPEPKPTDKSDDFGFAEKAYLNSLGIKGKTEQELAKQFMEDSGKSLEDVVESKFFQSELKSHREQAAADDAIPANGRRSAQSARDSVEYWINKGELPPPDQRELRTKVVNARLKAETAKNTFTDTPVVQGN